MRRLIASLLLAAVTVVGVASTAHAESKTIHDETGPDQQDRANALTHANITYAPHRVIWRIKVKHLSRADTRAFGSIYFPDDVTVRVATRHTTSGRRVTYGEFYIDGYYDRFTSGIESHWDYARDVVTITLTKDWVLYNPRNWANFDAFTIMRGVMHGPHCGPRVRCNDDYVFTRLRRG